MKLLIKMVSGSVGWPVYDCGSHSIFFYDIGVTVLVDSKALLTVLGSEMDYVEDKLSSQFVFHNPNVKGTCGCGESFMV